uniref:uncharacterized protein LOC100424277 isoform X5 n=1 Tax=Macaca mulatta TaxID=9544 RepID=UPI0010A2A5E6|nr:uncharacterized protein LOC100424277 isoform X5 [Macaca mulatta]
MTSIALCLPAVFPMAGVPCKALATSQLSGSDLPRLLQPPVPRKLRQDEHLLSALWGSVPHRHLLWTPWGVAQLRPGSAEAYTPGGPYSNLQGCRWDPLFQYS